MKNNHNNESGEYRREGDKRPGKRPPLPGYRRGPLSWLIIAIIVFNAMMMLQQGLTTNTLRWDQFLAQLEQGNIERIEIGDTQIIGKLREDAPGAKERSSLTFKVSYRPEAGAQEQLDRALLAAKEKGLEIEQEWSEQKFWVLWLLNWGLPFAVLIGLFSFFVGRNLRGGA